MPLNLDFVSKHNVASVEEAVVAAGVAIWIS